MSTQQKLPIVLIPGATGNIGKHAVSELHTKFGGKVHTKAGVRDKAKASKTFESLSGLDLVYYDTNEPSSIEQALHGVDALFLIPPTPSATTDRSKSTLAQIEAAKKAGVKFILFLDVLFSDDDKLMLGREWGTYVAAIKATGIPYTSLNAPMFLENWWGCVGSLKSHNAFYFPVGADVPVNYASVVDLGVAGAHILANYTQHIGKSYTVTGPSLITNAQIATELSNLTKRVINFYQATPEQAIEAMKQVGFQDWQAKGVVELWDRTTAGDSAFRIITSDYHTLTGSQPTDFKDFLKQLAHAI